eukprot:3941118-Rhodomonas_salina.1
MPSTIELMPLGCSLLRRIACLSTSPRIADCIVDCRQAIAVPRHAKTRHPSKAQRTPHDTLHHYRTHCPSTAHTASHADLRAHMPQHTLSQYHTHRSIRDPSTLPQPALLRGRGPQLP